MSAYLLIAFLLLLMFLGGSLIFLSSRPALGRFPFLRISTLAFGAILFVGVGWWLGLALRDVLLR